MRITLRAGTNLVHLLATGGAWLPAQYVLPHACLQSGGQRARAAWTTSSSAAAMYRLARAQVIVSCLQEYAQPCDPFRMLVRPSLSLCQRVAANLVYPPLLPWGTALFEWYVVPHVILDNAGSQLAALSCRYMIGYILRFHARPLS